MRTQKEIYDEAMALRAEVNKLYAHFQDVQTWESGPEKVVELLKLTKSMIAANQRVEDLALEMIQARRAERGDAGTDNINFIN